MTRPSDAQISKLPKWALEYMFSLERAVESKSTLLAQIKEGGDSDFSFKHIADFLKHDATPFRLPHLADVSVFDTPERQGFADNPCLRLRVRSKGVLEVMSIACGIVVRPQASNVVLIQATDFFQKPDFTQG